jgi:hypothetical protein
LFTSEVPQPSTVLPETSTDTPPGVLTSSTTVSLQRRRESILKGRVASIDLRIGLNLLGQEGRKLLAEYISAKRQH